MRCDEALRALEETVGGTLGPGDAPLRPEEAAALAAHVSGCAPCTAVRDEIRSAAALVGAALAADAAAEAEADRRLASRTDASLAARRPRGVVRRLVRAPWLTRAAVVLAAVVVGYAWRSSRAPEEAEVAKETYRLRPPSVPGYDGPRFRDVTLESGIQAMDHTGVSDVKDWMVETVGHGAAVFDFDGDGDLDLFVPDGNRLEPSQRVSGTWRLYRNDGGMRFTDVTQGSGVARDSWGSGAVAGDVDGDGRPDLFVPCFGRNHLFRNLGGGRFEDVADRAGVAGPEHEWSTSAALGDLDGDGDLDLYVANYADMRRYMVEATGGRGCRWRTMEVACGPQPLDPQQDRLYLNRGDGTFDDATATSLPALRRYSFQAVIADLDRDGAPDVYVACDGQPNLLLRNDGTGRFTELGREAGAASNGAGVDQAGMGVAAGDVDGDGRLDLFVTNFSHETNCLYRSLAAPRPLFADVTASARLEGPSRLTLGWGAALADLDLDGDLDLAYANGHLYPRVEQVVPETTYAQHVAVLRNDGVGRFEEVSADAGDVVHPRVHRGLVAADLDDDGDTDLFLTVLNDRPVLLRNDGRGVGRSVGFLLRRRGGRVEAAGAVLTAEVRGLPGRTRVVRDLVLGSSFGSSEDPRLSVGLGAMGSVASVGVRWPFGSEEAIAPPDGEDAFAPGAVYEVVEGTPRARRVR